MVLAMTHEEVVADLVRSEIRSYRQLPRLIYHIQTKWRDDPRPRAGLIRVREFTMKDSYSLDADWEGLDAQYRAHYQAYFNIFRRCGLPVVAVQSDVGMMGGKLAHEYMYLTPIGEDTLLLCDACGYAANRQMARFRKPAAGRGSAPAQSRRSPPRTARPSRTWRTSWASPKRRTAKAVFMMATIAEEDERPCSASSSPWCAATWRSTRPSWPTPSRRRDLRPATEEEIRAVGAVPGYASPVGLKGVLVVVDEPMPASPNLVAGANEEGYHLLQRQLRARLSAPTSSPTSPPPGRATPARSAARRCAPRAASRWATSSSWARATATRWAAPSWIEDGQSTAGRSWARTASAVGRLLACVAEEHHDEHGLIWPVSVAPYPVHLVALAGKDSRRRRTRPTRCTQRLTAAGHRGALRRPRREPRGQVQRRRPDRPAAAPDGQRARA